MKIPKIQKELFIKNRSKLKKHLLPDSSVVLFAAGLMPRNGDQFYKYRQSSDFFYLTGIEQEKSILVINPSHPDENLREVLFIIQPSQTMEVWQGKKLSAGAASEISGIKHVLVLDDYEKIIFNILKNTKNIYLNLRTEDRKEQELRTREVILSKKIQSVFPSHSFHDLSSVFQMMRMIKEPEEISAIRKGSEITRDAFLRVLKFIKPGVYEKEVEAEIIHEFIRKGAYGHAFHPIIASGENATYLHYNENKDICNDGELLLIDFGAEVNNYASDCSRTVPINGKFSIRQAELYDGLLHVFKKCLNIMGPGQKIQEFHGKVCEFMQQFHINSGLYTQKDIENNKDAPPLWFKYYMHGTSHSLGLDVHDPFNKDLILQPGMVMTVEPGIYLKNEGIGIRIENDVLITENGIHDLMHDIPVERAEIEKLMNSENK